MNGWHVNNRLTKLEAEVADLRARLTQAEENGEGPPTEQERESLAARFQEAVEGISDEQAREAAVEAMSEWMRHKINNEERRKA